MDASTLAALAFVAVGLWFVARPLVVSIGTAGDIVAQLFVPPDRSLGWPRGVQESDAPWGWLSPSAVVDPTAAGHPGAPDLEALDLVEPATVVRAGSFVVPVQPVRRH